MDSNQLILLVLGCALAIAVFVILTAQELRAARLAARRAHCVKRHQLARELVEALHTTLSDGNSPAADTARAGQKVASPSKPPRKASGPATLAPAAAPAIINEIEDQARQNPQAFSAAIRNLMTEG